MDRRPVLELVRDADDDAAIRIRLDGRAEVHAVYNEHRLAHAVGSTQTRGARLARLAREAIEDEVLLRGWMQLKGRFVLGEVVGVLESQQCLKPRSRPSSRAGASTLHKEERTDGPAGQATPAQTVADDVCRRLE